MKYEFLDLVRIPVLLMRKTFRPNFDWLWAWTKSIELQCIQQFDFKSSVTRLLWLKVFETQSFSRKDSFYIFCTTISNDCYPVLWCNDETDEVYTKEIGILFLFKSGSNQFFICFEFQYKMLAENSAKLKSEEASLQTDILNWEVD